MKLLIIAEYILLSVVTFKNIRYILSCMSNLGTVSDKKDIMRTAIVIFTSALTALSAAYKSGAEIRLMSFCAQYFFLILATVGIQSFKVTFFTVIMYLNADSIIQSSICMLLPQITSREKAMLTVYSVSLIINVVIYFVIHKQLKCIDISVVPQSVYLLVFLSLFVLGGLGNNQITVITNEKMIMKNTVNSLFIGICSVLFLSTVIVLLFYCISNSSNKRIASLLKKQIESQIEYYNMVERKNSEIRAFRHDYKNHLICIQSLMDNKEYEDAKDYLSQLNINNIFNNDSIFSSGNKIADVILFNKKAAAERTGIIIEFDGEIYENIPAPDICTILSNALDNAIEACNKCESRNLIIEVKCIYTKGVQIILITNPYNNCEQNGERFIISKTTKKDKANHGFGLMNIKHIVDKYNGEMNITMKDSVFKLEVMFRID